MFQRLTIAYIRWARRFWPLLIIISLLLAWPALQRTIGLFKNLDTDFANLLPDEYESVQLINKIRDKYASGGNIWVILESNHKQRLERFTLELADQFQEDEQVRTLEYEKPAYDFFDEHKMLYVSLADLKEIREQVDRRIQREKLGSLYISLEDDEPKTFNDLISKYEDEYSTGARSRYFESEDGTIYMFNLRPLGSSSDFAHIKKFFSHVREKTESYESKNKPDDLKLYYAGSIRTRVDEYNSLLEDLRRAGIVAAVGMLLVLLLLFRGVRPLLMVIIPLMFGMIYTFGLSSLFISGFNTVTAFLFAIMMGLGIDFGVHMVSRYLEERSQGASIEDALRAVLHNVGRASATSAATTATAFLLLHKGPFLPQGTK